ncbi:MAG: DNA replication protein DnaC [Chloroflexi bacterium]|nr:MAG: DNA replication protein DnaC [Chloroflexota bacterium]
MAGATSKESTPTSSNTERAGSLLGDPHCPICGGLGYIRLDVPLGHPDFGKLFPCACRAAEIRERRTEALRTISNIAALDRFTFETFRPEGQGLSPDRQHNLRWAYDLAHAFAAHPEGWLVLRGGYGCGKTHLAAAIANACVAQGLPVLFLTVPDLLDHLRAAFSPSAGQTYDERFEEVRTAPLLILDDLGIEQSTSWALEKLFQLLNYRYMSRLPTVITTNHELEELEPRLRSRLADPDLVQLVTILAPDYRQAGMEQTHSGLNTLPLYAEMTLGSFDLRQRDLPREQVDNLRRALELAQTYAEHPAGWLLFTGLYGCGKTHLAAAIANERVRLGHPALFIVVPDLLDHLRATFNPQSPVSYDKRFEEVRRTPFLVLDDLGTESATPWAQEKLYQLFNYRYVAQLPTVITTAKEVDELDAKLRTRLLDARRCVIFGLTAPPYLGGVARAKAVRRAKKKR